VALPIATSASNNPALPAASADQGLAPPAPDGPARRTSDGHAAATAEAPKKTSPLPEKLGLPAASAMAKTESKVCLFSVVSDIADFLRTHLMLLPSTDDLQRMNCIKLRNPLGIAP
jgi:hypothetical protein